MKSGDRILSAYLIDDSKPCNGTGCNTLLIITDANRSGSCCQTNTARCLTCRMSLLCSDYTDVAPAVTTGSYPQPAQFY